VPKLVLRSRMEAVSLVSSLVDSLCGNPQMSFMLPLLNTKRGNELKVLCSY